MKIIKTYMETTPSGVYKVQEQSNGIKVKFLREPSMAYIEKRERRRIKEEEKAVEEKIRTDKERLIKIKMREIAIRELESEGKLTPEPEPIPEPEPEPILEAEESGTE